MNFRELIEGSRGEEKIFPDNDNFQSEYFSLESVKSFPACIDLRFSSGNRFAVPYSSIIKLEYCPDNGISIFTTDNKILIEGRCLIKLYDYLVSYKVKYIKEHTGLDSQSEELFIKSIIVDDI